MSKRAVVVIILLVFGWSTLLYASSLPLLESIQAIGVGLGLLVTCRIVQHWK